MKPNANILVLEDEPLLRLMLVSQLEQQGVKVHAADCCAAALTIIRQVELDAALFDYRLPDGTGVDLLRRLRGEQYQWPVIMLSGEAEHISPEMVSELQVAAVLAKPPQMDQIRAAFSELQEGAPAPAAVYRKGRYVVWDIPDQVDELPPEIAGAELLALNFSDRTSLPSSEALMVLLREHPALVAIGTTAECRQRVSELSPAVEFAEDLEELAAQGRRRTERGERQALLESVVRRDLVKGV